jgi:NAD(P)-dependent dehydrogenase (short-subunit alcohol dehydrogenase family)
MEERRICIITGANSGIGKEAAVQIAAEGFHVVMACRSAARAEAALADIRRAVPNASAEVMQVNMGLQSSVRAFAAAVADRYGRVDVLIHNAAVFDVAQKERVLTPEGTELVWAVNHLGPVLLTVLLLDQLKASDNGRVITISSQGLVAMPRLKVDVEDPEFERRRFSAAKAYYQSKRAQVMFTRWLADKLSGSRVTANSIRVTAVKVDLARHPELSTFQRWAYSIKSRMSLEPAQMARTYTWLATSPEVSEMTGKYFNEKKKEVKDVAYSEDMSAIQAVMAMTARYIPVLMTVIAHDSEN